MKIIKFVGLLLYLLFLGAMACKKDFLEVPPPASFRDEKLRTKDGIEGALIATYSILTGRQYSFYSGSTNWFWGSVLGGDSNKGSDPGDQSQMNEIQSYATQATNESVYAKYAASYEGVARANMVLSSLANPSETIPEEDKKRIAAEAMFLRGHYYFDLKKIFGNVPYAHIDEKTNSKVVDYEVDLWPKIEADFLFAYKNLPSEQKAIGRANKWAAAAYLGKTYLFQKKYGDARILFDSVMRYGKTNSGARYGLMEKYGDLFQAATSDNNKESIFAIQAAVGAGHAANANGDFMLNYPYTGGPAGCCGFNQPSFDLVNSFRTNEKGLPLLDGSYNHKDNAVKSDMGIDAKTDFVPDTKNLDPRLDYSVGRRGIPYWNWGPHPGQSWMRKQSNGGPYSPKKFVYNKGDAVEVSTWNNLTGNNYSIIRYADVLLMAAEAEAGLESGDLEKARGYVNQVRQRAKNPEGFVKMDEKSAPKYVINLYDDPWTGGEARKEALKAIQFERKLELSGEGHRFFDLVRWGIAENTLTDYIANERANGLTGAFDKAKFTVPRSERQPIPQQEIDLVGADKLKQNKGY